MRTDDVLRQESAGIGPVTLKEGSVTNECCLIATHERNKVRLFLNTCHLNSFILFYFFIDF